MAKKNCVICDQEGHLYFPFCYKHLKEKSLGLIEKCENCNKWYLSNKNCECQAPKSKKSNCVKCGKLHNGKYDTCYDCYNKTVDFDFFNDIKKKALDQLKKDRENLLAAIETEKNTGDSIDIRKKWPAIHRCSDGHYVRSYSEALIDNWLYENDHVHAYEKKVFLRNNPNDTLLSDFYIPNGKIYIEFFGLENVKYKMRKEDKIELYKNNNLNLIVLEKNDISLLDDILPRKLYEFQK